MIPIHENAFLTIKGKRAESKIFMVDCLYKSNHQYPKHVDRFDRISVVLAGQLKEEVGKEAHYASSTSFVVKPSGVLHTNQFGPSGARLISLVFDPEFVKQLELADFFSQIHWVHTSKMTAQIIKAISQLKHSQDWMSESIDLLASLSLHQVSKETIPPSWLQRVKEKISDEEDLNLSVKDLAATENLHPVYMARMFRKFEGCGIKEYMHRVKMQRVSHWLTDTQLPLVQIALDLGFADQSHMSRIFKNFVGISPAAFRRFSKNY